MHNLTDYQLVTSYQDTKDMKYFNAVYIKYTPLINKHIRYIYNVIKPHDRTIEHRDIDQDIKIALYKTLHKIDRKEIENTKDFYIYTYLNGEIKNFRNEIFRKKGNYMESIDDNPMYTTRNPISDYMRMLGLVDEFYDMLPVSEKKVFKMYMETKEKDQKKFIAKKLGITPQGMSRIIERMKKRLYEYAEKNSME